MWQNLARPPLNQERLRRDLRDSRWQQIVVLPEASSTQEEALARRTGEDLVVIAEYQSAGRGRRDRTWVSPAQAGITMSLLFENLTPTPWIGTMVSMAAVTAVNQLSSVEATLKWPNDLMLGGKKFGGVISEVHEGAVIVGIGINVSTKASELPVEGATSLHLSGAEIDREPLVKAILRAVTVPLVPELRENYLRMLSTLNQEVRVQTPDGEVTGIATNVDDSGRLVLDSGAVLSVGDVIHVR